MTDTYTQGLEKQLEELQQKLAIAQERLDEPPFVSIRRQLNKKNEDEVLAELLSIFNYRVMSQNRSCDINGTAKEELLIMRYIHIPQPIRWKNNGLTFCSA
jgi:hypothetical protein